MTKAHHLVQVGNFHRAHVRIAEPYFVDRRFRGSSAWTRDRPCRAANGEKEGGIVHMAPDPNVAEKACRSWLCVETGAPDRWCPYEALIVR